MYNRCLLLAQKFVLPEIKTLGTYECNVQLHPDVTGSFKVVVQRLKEAGKK